MRINVVKNVLNSNDVVAEKNREMFRKAGLLAVNLISSPGSGKTTLLEKTIPELGRDKRSVVLVGDLDTTRDAERLEPHAAEVTQINTGMSCHLYANQVSGSLEEGKLKGMDYLFIENVGNLVCPGEFDLGENVKVVLLSLPEGDDKVAKYPTVFRVADVVLLTKVDLKDALGMDTARIYEDLGKLNPGVKIFEISARCGKGMKEWIDWLKTERKKGVGVKARKVE
ncbi:MAG: hydrogenase nickel incorporation protein HypB [Candidatus Omnitrophica bacterium]|nr:hydrogenase nickel incorporation protein HypB [Candidatus Omnitrophota bacterium]MDD5487737.1 hydrogenase nickel incorporation protein HypB [Candidatus Omnitrophota bacterium]